MSGPLLPGVLAHRGYDIARLIEHLYLGTEGIYGIATGVVATYVFHFVLLVSSPKPPDWGHCSSNLPRGLQGDTSGDRRKFPSCPPAFWA